MNRDLTPFVPEWWVNETLATLYDKMKEAVGIRDKGKDMAKVQIFSFSQQRQICVDFLFQHIRTAGRWGMQYTEVRMWELVRELELRGMQFEPPFDMLQGVLDEIL